MVVVLLLEIFVVLVVVVVVVGLGMMVVVVVVVVVIALTSRGEGRCRKVRRAAGGGGLVLLACRTVLVRCNEAAPVIEAGTENASESGRAFHDERQRNKQYKAVVGEKSNILLARPVVGGNKIFRARRFCMLCSSALRTVDGVSYSSSNDHDDDSENIYNSWYGTKDIQRSVNFFCAISWCVPLVEANRVGRLGK